MVHSESFEGKTVFVCDACGLAYRDESIATQCQAYCLKHNACNLELMRHAVQRT